MLALRIGNDVSYEARINHEIHFAWQAQYLVRFEVDFGCCKSNPLPSHASERVASRIVLDVSFEIGNHRQRIT